MFPKACNTFWFTALPPSMWCRSISLKKRWSEFSDLSGCTHIHSALLTKTMRMKTGRRMLMQVSVFICLLQDWTQLSCTVHTLKIRPRCSLFSIHYSWNSLWYIFLSIFNYLWLEFILLVFIVDFSISPLFCFSLGLRKFHHIRICYRTRNSNSRSTG